MKIKIKADLFNNYFWSQSVVNNKNTELTNYNSFSDTCTISNIVISTQDVKDVSETLDTIKATVLYQPNILKTSFASYCRNTKQVFFFNLPLRKSTVPAKLKIANVITVFKKSASNIVSYQRPISL